MYKNSFNKTKIVATIGPATSSKEKLRELIKAGVDVCRINMSHGTHEQHKAVIEAVRELNAELGSHICILLDLQGPKLRIGKVEGEGIDLRTGAEITVRTTEIISTAAEIFVNYPHLATEAKPGERVLLDDGKLELKITGITDSQTLKARVVQGGRLTSNKGFNLPDTRVSLPALTEKDIADAHFGLENNVEWIGLSFVRRPEDIISLKDLIRKEGKEVKVISKIEKPEAVEAIDAIINVTDGVMVARGDLGVEVPIQKVPLIQKKIVNKCIDAAKPVIIATQMMESMITNSMPTRAEVTDVANAVLDGADAVMLSAETSVGQFPVRVVEVVESIVRDVELSSDDVYYKGKRPEDSSPTFLSDEICFTSVRMSSHIGAKAIIAMTRSGYTGYKVASYRPEADIFIFTDNRPLLNTLNLVWGVRGFYYDKFESTDKTIYDVVEILKANDIVVPGDRVLNCMSMPIHRRSRTNTIKITVVH